MDQAGKVDLKQAEREVARGFLAVVVVAALVLAAIAVPVALFLFVRPFGPFVALAVVAVSSWWCATRAGFGLAALVFGLAGGALLLLVRVGLFLVFLRRPFLWLGREAVALAALYLVLFVTSWVRTQYAGAKAGEAEQTEPASPAMVDAAGSDGGPPTPKYTDAEFVVKG